MVNYWILKKDIDFKNTSLTQIYSDDPLADDEHCFANQLNFEIEENSLQSITKTQTE
jgi:hypothetical protein